MERQPGAGGPRLVVVAGTTRTARIEGISAAGADAALRVHTPSADAEIVAYGRLARAPVVPASPAGCPTPAVGTRAVRELLGVPLAVVDAGLAKPTAAPTVDLGAAPGGDVREPAPVPGAAGVLDRARALGRALPAGELVVGETVPAGTTTAMGTLAALGERPAVSSSLPDNPLARKRAAVEEGLAASGLARGEAAGDPAGALRAMGDPVLAAVTGIALGAADAGTAITLAGGTQMLAAAALARGAGHDGPLTVATTSFVADDPTADVRGLAADLGVDLLVTDPGFEPGAHVATDRYLAGEAKEGVGMGGALALADRAGRLDAFGERFVAVCERLFAAAAPAPPGAGSGVADPGGATPAGTGTAPAAERDAAPEDGTPTPEEDRP